MSKKKSASQILKKRARKKQKSRFFKFIKWSVWSVILAAFAGGCALAGVYFYLSRDLPKISSLADYRPPIITTVYSDDNRKIAEFCRERRIVVPLENIPEKLLQAFVAAEDSRFYKHKGIDLLSIIRAFFKNLEAGTIVQGGSTITQQVTKSFLLTPERSYRRKIKEAILAYRIDKIFSKEEILFLYLNQIYLGHAAYGVEAASENYFGKSIMDLNLAECAILAGLPQAPSRYSPFRHPERAKKRQIYVLNRMVGENYITNIEATEAINTELDIKPRKNWYIEEVPVYTEHIRRYIEQKYGPDVLYREGLKVYSAVNIEMQKIARKEIERGLTDLDKRQGFRGPLQHIVPEEIEAFSETLAAGREQNPLEPGIILKGVVTAVDDQKKTVSVSMGEEKGVIALTDMKWARTPDPEIAYYQARVRRPGDVLSRGDVIQVRLKSENAETRQWALALEQEPAAQAALLCIEAETGKVKAMVGGLDFRQSQFNRAIQSRRQPGSAFKPVIYAAALDKGYTPATMLIDSPIVYEDKERDFTWKPKNYKKKFYGPTLLRKALVKSRNVVTIKILKDIGIDYAIDYARKLGITSDISRDLSMALGSSGLSLLELSRAYSVFANQGYLVDSVFITKIIDRDGNVLEEAHPVKEKVIDKSTAYIMTNLLEGVVKQGTGHRIRALKRPAAGKTGTTNNLFDAWFVGYTPRYITGTWVGFDTEKPLGKSETGSRAASPIWLGFMKKILADKPVRVFQVPEEVIFSKIDAETGLLPISESKKTIFECFKEGTAPTEYTKKPGEVTEAEEFFKLDM
ncbi:MAG: PBP1A family penicillin-binding protein [Deltaproteobacteria bacterium]|nr:PBP1A family penicillin-binding protein [Deltaproteobacteria bacterium]